MSKGLLTSMQWRRAIKGFNKGSVDISPILEAVRWAPSSMGVQPYYVHVVSNQELKKKIHPVAYGQPQVLECDHLLVFTARNDTRKALEDYVDVMKVPAGPAKNIYDALGGLTSDEFLRFSTSQAFIGLGFALTAAADLRIGACPMGGFEADKVKNVMKLPDNETVVAFMAVGVAPPDDDPRANPYPKARFPLDHLVKRHP